MTTPNSTKKEVLALYARVLSPIGTYPAESICFDDAAYIRDNELSFSVCRYKKHTRGGGDESYSEVEWLNSIEARLYGSLMLSVDRDIGYSAFYPYPITELISCETETIDKNRLILHVKPYLRDKIAKPYVLHPGCDIPAMNNYRRHADIASPPIIDGPEYDFCSSGIDYELARTLYNSIDINDDLLIRGLTALIKAAMLHFHYQFVEAAIYSLFISMEVSFMLVIRALKAKGIAEPTSKDAMTYIHDVFNDIQRVDKYFEEYYKGRIQTFHPESRYGIYPHAPLQADDYYFLFRDMQEIYAFLICGYVHPKHKEKLKYLDNNAT